jgi:hypothetical protein
MKNRNLATYRVLITIAFFWANWAVAQTHVDSARTTDPNTGQNYGGGTGSAQSIFNDLGASIQEAFRQRAEDEKRQLDEKIAQRRQQRKEEREAREQLRRQQEQERRDRAEQQKLAVQNQQNSFVQWKPISPYRPPSDLSVFSSTVNSYNPISSPSLSQKIDELMADGLGGKNDLGADIDDLLSARTNQPPLDNFPSPKAEGEKGDWRNKPGLRLSASMSDFLYQNANVVAYVCDSKGTPAFSGPYLKVYNAGKKPFYFSSITMGQAVNTIVAPGETYLQMSLIYRDAAHQGENLYVDMDATYWHETP